MSSEDRPVRLLDTTPAFEAFAKKAFLEPMMVRTSLWHEHYEAAHPDVVAALAAECGELAVTAVVRNLSHVRRLADQASNVMPGLIGDVEPGVQQAIGASGDARPLHVLVVGTFAANALVTRIGDDVAVMHCVEWFAGEEPTRVLAAHETTHAWHQLMGGDAATEDLAWRAFSEGLAVHVSRTVVPDRPEDEYFWYGVEGFEEWLPWCREHRDRLLEQFREGLEDPDAVDAFFGAGFVDDHWRVGYFVADEILARIGRPLHELAQLDPDAARAAVREALDA